MMEVIPEKLEGTVVFNLTKNCNNVTPGCTACTDFAVGIHNFLVTSELKYMVMDLQDEKEVCPAFLEEVMQLKKRLRFPFLFAGVMDRPKKVLLAYDYGSQFPFFLTPEDAVATIKKQYPHLLDRSLEGLAFGQPISATRQRQGVKGDGEVEGEEVADDGADDADDGDDL